MQQKCSFPICVGQKKDLLVKSMVASFHSLSLSSTLSTMADVKQLIINKTTFLSEMRLSVVFGVKKATMQHHRLGIWVM